VDTAKLSEAGVSFDENNLRATGLIDSIAVDLLKTERVPPTVRLIDLVHEIGKRIFDDCFHLIIAELLLFFQHKNCEIQTDAAQGVVEGETISLSNLVTCDIYEDILNIDKMFLISVGLLGYGFCIAIIIFVHAHFIKDHDRPPVQDMFKWTDRIPLFDSLFEIPICMWVAPVVTILLWAAYLGCCVLLIMLFIAYNKAEHVGGNPSAFAVTAVLVAFDLYRLTGNIAQYYVINKSANLNTRQKERNIIDRLSLIVNKDQVV